MPSPAPQTSAGILLAKQLKLMQGPDSIEGISVGLVSDTSLFDWEVMLMISDECRLYGGGFFKATLKFPKDYPHAPPKMRFETPIWHPNSMFLLFWLWSGGAGGQGRVC
jgi:ubiquitin-conjugating enzyme E2 G1